MNSEHSITIPVQLHYSKEHDEISVYVNGAPLQTFGKHGWEYPTDIEVQSEELNKIVQEKWAEYHPQTKEETALFSADAAREKQLRALAEAEVKEVPDTVLQRVLADVAANISVAAEAGKDLIEYSMATHLRPLVPTGSVKAFSEQIIKKLQEQGYAAGMVGAYPEYVRINISWWKP